MKSGERKHPSQPTRPRTGSIARKINGKLQITAFNLTRHLRPTCGAAAKSTGEMCRDIAMANGRCYRHGGRTPKGKNWHLPVWPDRDAPDAMAKVDRKLRDLQKAAERRERRIAVMSPEEREAYDQWKRSHKSGSPADRARARIQRKHDAAVREFLSREPVEPATPASAEAAQAAAALALRRKQSEAAASREAASRSTTDENEEQNFQGAFS